MQSYSVKLQSEISNSFRCTLAAQSLDIDVEKKSIHELNINADLNKNFNVGVIVGSSGSGKTTLAKQIFGQDIFNVKLNENLPIIDQLPKELSYDECAEILSGIGLTSVPCWIRPVKTLSNGQKARAEAAFLMTNSNEIIVLDEWTSVVDRTVAKVMSHCVQKFARKHNKKIILLSCHFDVIEWINPDWIIDCNNQSFIDRGLLSIDERKRKEQLEFTIKQIDKSSWRYFSKYHYLSDKLPGGKNYYFGLFNESNQIGFICFSNYVPLKKGHKMIYHFNRTVIHPDYAGMGLGILLINETSKIMKKNHDYKLMGKFSSVPVAKSMLKHKTLWKLCEIKRQQGKIIVGGSITRKHGYRENIKTYSFEYIG